MRSHHLYYFGQVYEKEKNHLLKIELMESFSCIGVTLLRNSCSNETLVGVDSICSSFQPFGNQRKPNGVS